MFHHKIKNTKKYFGHDLTDALFELTDGISGLTDGRNRLFKNGN